MTAAFYESIVDQGSDAAFRTLFLEFSNTLSTVGLIKTSDTGQIDWATVTRASSNNDAGYELWRTQDSTTFYKFYYGSGSANTVPRVRVRVGRGSDGVGNLTGAQSTLNTFAEGVQASSSTPYRTSMSASNDHLTIIFAQNATNTSTSAIGMLQVHKLVNSSGATTTEGITVIRLPGLTSAPSSQTVRWAATAKAFNDTTAFALVPGDMVASEPSPTLQTWPCFANDPKMRVNPGAIVYISAELVDNKTFQVKPVGSTAHTYLSFGRNSSVGPAINGSGSINYGLALRYD